MIKKLARPFELKTLDDSGTFTGYGSVFDVEDSYGDVIEKGAFKATLGAWKAKGKLPALLWQHDPRLPIGVYEEMAEDSKGLYVKGRLLKDEVKTAAEAYALMRAGAVSGLSIGYEIPKGGGDWDPKAEVFRIRQVDLWEVSPVTFPANDSARVDAVKSLDSPRDLERFLRDAGMSRAAAKALVAGGYRALAPWDAEAEAGSSKEIAEAIATLTRKIGGN